MPDLVDSLSLCKVFVDNQYFLSDLVATGLGNKLVFYGDIHGFGRKDFVVTYSPHSHSQNCMKMSVT